MKISNIKSASWHKYDNEGPNVKPGYFKKGFWKVKDRKKFIRKILKQLDNINDIQK